MKKFINYLTTFLTTSIALLSASSLAGIVAMGFIFLFQNIGVNWVSALKVILIISALISLFSLKEENDNAAKNQ